MSAEFRQRKPSEYLKILQRRKWLVILPTIAIGIAVAYVVYRLPDVYESSTLIVVRPSTLPKNVVPASYRRQPDATVGRHPAGRKQPQLSRAAGPKVRSL